MWNLKNIAISAGISLGTTVVTLLAKHGISKGAEVVAKRRKENQKG